MRSIIFSTKVFAVTTLIFLNFSSLSAQSGSSIYELPAGTRIKVRMDTEINSKVNRVNDTFIVRVIEPVFNRGVEMIPRGALIDGRILRGSAAAYGGYDGVLEVDLVRLRLNRKDVIEIDASPVKRFEAPSRTLFKVATIGGLTAVGALFGSAVNSRSGMMVGAGIGGASGSVIAFGRKGSDVKVKTNEEFEIVLKKEAVLPVKEF
ncbi:MAG: hypothetical protein PSX80_02705 [bacterium]|nr:hypothetical protein [bacterium]